jgi:hypothetical protein
VEPFRFFLYDLPPEPLRFGPTLSLCLPCLVTRIQCLFLHQKTFASAGTDLLLFLEGEILITGAVRRKGRCCVAVIGIH